MFWIHNKTFDEEEIAIRYKHKIVAIHCFANGNERHSRLMADVIISHVFRKTVFFWSIGNLVTKGEERSTYLKAIRSADRGALSSLIDFAKS